MNRFARVHGQVGVSEIPVGGALDVALDAAAYEVNRGLQGDCGVMVIWEPTEDRSWAIDTSGRARLAPAVYDGLGWYSDLFFDTVLSRTWLIAAGATATREPDPEFDDLALAGFVRVTASVR